MQFKIEQVALCVEETPQAMKLLREMGLTDWVEDRVTAEGFVYGASGVQENEAVLRFNYSAFEGRELEVLDYKSGHNWMDSHSSRVSHFGMHCTEDELEQWREFFRARNIPVAQEVDTFAHTNPAIAGKRSYHYCIFDTWPILGVDIKFIVRKDVEG